MLDHKHLLLMGNIDTPPENEQVAEKWIKDLINILNMKALIEPKAVYCHTEGNRGLTCICAIETSHIALHIWDEPNPSKMQLDVYTCSTLNLDSVWKMISKFNATNVRYKFYDREKEFKLLQETNTPVTIKE